LGGRHTLPLQFDFLSISQVVSLTSLAVTFFFINQLLVAVAIGLSTGTRFIVAFGRVVAPSGANLLYDVLVSPIAVLVALLYSFGVPGLIMVSLPLLIIRHSYVSNQKLQQANKDLLTVLVKAIETRDPYTS